MPHTPDQHKSFRGSSRFTYSVCSTPFAARCSHHAANDPSFVQAGVAQRHHPFPLSFSFMIPAFAQQGLQHAKPLFGRQWRRLGILLQRNL